ncbi:MmpS family transport accessory protein [Mycolicibacterium lutetiense]
MVGTPPPKKDKTWLWVLSAIVAVIVLAIGGVAGFKYYERNRKVTFTYEVTGTGATAMVDYSFNGGGVSETTEVPLPWTKTFEGTRRSAFQLTANAPYGETVTCKVSIDGKIIVTKTEPSGPWAACMGQYYD